MGTYRTAEVAAAVGVHPNTVRLYETWGLIPKPERRPNGYRVFTDVHLEQFRLARCAFQVEVLQNGLRKNMIQVVKVSAAGDYDRALSLAAEYLAQLRRERTHAEEAATLVREMLSGEATESTHGQRRKEVSASLGISMDTLRSWEMNGLLTVKRRENGYRVYTGQDIRRLKIIRSLRCANYSLEAILQMLLQLSRHPNVDILAALNTPGEHTDMIAVCDKLLTSLSAAARNAERMMDLLEGMKLRYSKPSILPPMF